jgi:hypothetical protein
MRKLATIICLTLAMLLGGEVRGSDLPACKGSPSSDASYTAEWDNCQGTYTYANGDKYVGEFRGGEFHGQGALIFAPFPRMAASTGKLFLPSGVSNPSSKMTGKRITGPFEDGLFMGTKLDRQACRELNPYYAETDWIYPCVRLMNLSNPECPAGGSICKQSDKGICLGIPYGNKDFIKEGKRRNLDCSKIR